MLSLSSSFGALAVDFDIFLAVFVVVVVFCGKKEEEMTAERE